MKLLCDLFYILLILIPQTMAFNLNDVDFPTISIDESSNRALPGRKRKLSELTSGSDSTPHSDLPRASPIWSLSPRKVSIIYTLVNLLLFTRYSQIISVNTTIGSDTGVSFFCNYQIFHKLYLKVLMDAIHLN